MRDKLFITSIGILVVAILIFIAWYARTNPLSNSGGEQNGVISISDSDWAIGEKNAPITLVEYADFQCPGCGAYHPIVKKVLEDNAGKIYFVFRHFPLTQIHANALLAATAAEAAGKQGKFWEMHDLIFKNQSEWSSATNAKPIFIRYAKNIGLDEGPFSKDISDGTIVEKIKAQYDEGVKIGVDRTPTFFLNGKKLKDNPSTYEAFNKLINAQ